MKISVVIASKGRPNDLCLWLSHMKKQTRVPDNLIWAVTSPEDFECGEFYSEQKGINLDIIYSDPGLCVQRNNALKFIACDADIVAFFDDDYIPHVGCVEGILKVFEAFPSACGLTGLLIDDGANTKGIDLVDAVNMVSSYVRIDGDIKLKRVRSLYGCNMAMRTKYISGMFFDENLPLYAWQEDFDFTVRLAERGDIYWTNGFAGLHRGAKGGRVSGIRLGYSQIANVHYLINKGTMPLFRGLKMMAGNFIKNTIRSICPEPWIDRKGRMIGNFIAIADVLLSRVNTKKIIDL